MKQLSRSKAAAKLFSPAAFALAVGLACWGSAALATSNPIPGIDIIVRKKPGGSIVVTPTSDHSGKFSVKLGAGDYTVSTACKPGGCTPSRISIDIKDYNEKLEADGSTSYEFHVGKGGLNLSGQTLSIDLPKGTGANDAPGKANQPIITKDVENGETQAFRGNRPILDEPASTTVKLQQPLPNQLRAGVLPVPGDYDEDGVETRTANPTQDGGEDLPSKKHNYKGVVTLVRGTAPNPNDVDKTPHNKYADDFKQLNTERVEKAGDTQKPGISEESNSAMGQVSTTRGRVGKPPVDPAGPAANHRVPQYEFPSNIPGVAAEVGKPPAGPAGISDQGTTGVIISYGTANPTNDVDTTPQNKYADDFKQLNTKLEALAIQVAGVTTLTTDMSSVKAQVTALQTAVAGLPTTASITALQTSLGSVDTKIDAITTTLNTVATAGTATKAIVDGLKTDLTALKTDLTAFAAKVTADNLAMKAQSTPLKKEDKKNASVDNAVRKTSAGSDPAGSPVGFGQGMPGRSPTFGGPNGPSPNMIPAPPMPSMPTMPTMGPAGGPSAMSPGGPGGPSGPGSTMHP